MSSYRNDPRVVLHGDDGATIAEGLPGEGEWLVREVDGVWRVDNPVQGPVKSTANSAFAATFRSRDEAIAAVIGPPQVTT
ncbi:hypothetical protein ACFFX1_55130 [Dactylosporangium sucinum]|uniref:Uncharacterized protein n=1 Tax=Dactylosporangium sucinum TaxID=1424081 RepID=A0A917U308_9ACTN|nr:hypothetical protein [Dactylosporangium sucinum]GGM53019.1 hypothetical protein GCM10007977_063340 [Dactylosporangium sucinum]